MKVTFLGTNSSGGSCPSVWATDRNTLIVQGNKVTDTETLEALRERGLPDHEDAVEIPLDLLPHFPRA